ncbi:MULTISPECIES: HAD family hydrolase [unclassified Streptomyces]|uniref:HAD family hydrolase n=1 Tax=unclassified Streptomyces TaxID=2593676 RepID=UPI0033C19164
MTPTGRTNIVIEAEGVLFHGGQSLTGELAGVPVRRIFHSTAWMRHSRGELSEHEAFGTIAATLNVSAAAVADAVTAHTHSWRSPPGLTGMLDALTAQGRRLCVALMPAAHHALLRERMPDLWLRFTSVVTTAALRTGLTSRSGVARLCRHWDIPPDDTVYLGADQHVLQFTRAHGILSVRYRTPADLWRLRDQAGRLKAAQDFVADAVLTNTLGSEVVLGTGERLPVEEISSPLYLLDAHQTIARTEPGQALLRWIASLGHDGLYTFLTAPQDALGTMPLDADDTALALTVLYTHGLADESTLQRAADRILANADADGLLQLYFTPERPRIDSVVCASALCLLHVAGRDGAPAARATEDFLHALLDNRGYEYGTLYTPSPDFFLYALFRIALRSPRFRDRFESLLVTRLS